MKFVIILFVVIAAVLVQAEFEDSDGEDVIPVRRSMKGLQGHVTRGNRRRHVDHVDAKWDTSDMDIDDAPVVPSRRALSKTNEDDAHKSSFTLPDMSFILPYIKTIIMEILKKLGGTKWEKVGRDTLVVVDDIVEIVTKSDNKT